MKINLKNFGFLEFLVAFSAIFVVGMLIWTASTRPAVEAKANPFEYAKIGYKYLTETLYKSNLEVFQS